MTPCRSVLPGHDCGACGADALVGASLVAVAVAVVVEGVVLATAGLLGAIGDEVIQIAAVVAPGVLLPLPVVVDALELVDEKAQAVVAQHL